MCLFEQVEFAVTLRHPGGVSCREWSQEQGLQIRKSRPRCQEEKARSSPPSSGPLTYSMGTWGTGVGNREREKKRTVATFTPGPRFPHLWNERRFGQRVEGNNSPCTLAVNPCGTVWGAAPVPKCRLLAKAPGLFPLGKP